MVVNLPFVATINSKIGCAEEDVDCINVDARPNAEGTPGNPG